MPDQPGTPRGTRPGVEEQETLARLEMALHALTTAVQRLAADRRRSDVATVCPGDERRKVYRDRRMDEALERMTHATEQMSSALRPLTQRALRAHLAAGHRVAGLLAKMRRTGL